jgi:hypothetical protein
MQAWDETVFAQMCAPLPPKEAAEARDYLYRLQRCWS